MDSIITEREIKQLPLFSRNFLDLAVLSPGVFVLLASSILIGLCATHRIEFSFSRTGGDGAQPQQNPGGHARGGNSAAAGALNAENGVRFGMSAGPIAKMGSGSE